jgi:hypothetical protein
MPNTKDIRITGVALYYLPVKTRIPLKFGPETTTHATCARVRVGVEGRDGRQAEGWGETPLSVAWVWPSELSYDERLATLKEFCEILAKAWEAFPQWGHPMEIGHLFQSEALAGLFSSFNRERIKLRLPPMPWLAALVCCASFDLALHDAYGILHKIPSFDTFNEGFMNFDLSWYFGEAQGKAFAGAYPAEFFARPYARMLPAWHLVGGKDLLVDEDRRGDEPDDGYPVVLGDWIQRDGLSCLKVKLTGTDQAWDYARLLAVGDIALQRDVLWLSADFNCTVLDPVYVVEVLDRLLKEAPRIFAMILYIEQPFPYDLEATMIDAHALSARKPLFMDESAHSWKYLALGRTLGWTGVALKTCKTLTGAILSLCWAKKAGMTLMVQDLTNPMLAQIPHLSLAAHAGTIMGVETNAMQFYPEASAPEAKIHPGMYKRVAGAISLDSLGTEGLGYRVGEIQRVLPSPVYKGEGS